MAGVADAGMLRDSVELEVKTTSMMGHASLMSDIARTLDVEREANDVGAFKQKVAELSQLA